MCARLGLHPQVARTLQPVEVMDLARGDQDQWNRVVLLGAWMAYMVCMCIPSFAKKGAPDWRKEVRGLKGFIDRFQPPGYVAEDEPAPKKRKRVPHGR